MIIHKILRKILIFALIINPFIEPEDKEFVLSEASDK